MNELLTTRMEPVFYYPGDPVKEKGLMDTPNTLREQKKKSIAKLGKKDEEEAIDFLSVPDKLPRNYKTKLMAKIQELKEDIRFFEHRRDVSLSKNERNAQTFHNTSITLQEELTKIIHVNREIINSKLKNDKAGDLYRTFDQTASRRL